MEKHLKEMIKRICHSFKEQGKKSNRRPYREARLIRNLECLRIRVKCKTLQK